MPQQGHVLENLASAIALPPFLQSFIKPYESPPTISNSIIMSLFIVSVW